MGDIQSVTLVDRRGYLTVVLEIEREENLVFRRPENVRDWFNSMQRMVVEIKAKEMQSTEEFWSSKVAKRSYNAQDHFSNNKPRSTTSLDRKRRRNRNDCK